MQLPPRSSSSYTVIPEKSFHLCQTCTLSSSHTQKGGPCTPPSPSCKCTLTPKRTHTLKTFPHDFSPHPRSSYFQRHPCQHSTETQPHLTASKSALQFSLQCKASLFPYEPALHRRTVSPQFPPPPQSRTFIQDNRAKKTGGIWILLPSCASQALVNGGWLGAE